MLHSPPSDLEVKHGFVYSNTGISSSSSALGLLNVLILLLDVGLSQLSPHYSVYLICWYIDTYISILNILLRTVRTIWVLNTILLIHKLADFCIFLLSCASILVSNERKQEV